MKSPLDGEAGGLLPVPSGAFMLLWPGEAHMPGLAVGSPAPLRKVVVKIAVCFSDLTGFKNLSGLALKTCQVLKSPLDGEAGGLLPVPSGAFMLLWPGEAHMPGLAVGSPARCAKSWSKSRCASQT